MIIPDIVTVAPGAASAMEGDAGAVPFVTGAGVGLATNPNLVYDNTYQILHPTNDASGLPALLATNEHASGIAIQGEGTQITGIPLIGTAPSGQTADLLQCKVNSVTKFAVSAAGTITTG